MSDRPSELARVVDWLDAVGRARAHQVLPVPGGYALLNPDLPYAHDHNRLVLRAPAAADAVADAADAVLGGVGLSHRLVEVLDHDVARELVEGMAARGYTHGDELLMLATAVEAPETDDRVVELDLAERSAAAADSWRVEQPGWEPAVHEQLGRRISTILPVVEATFLAVRGPDGSVVARADLYLRDGVAQVEEVATAPAQRGRGLASLLVRTAVDRARTWGAGTVFLVADADDWPQRLYRRLGFTDLGRTTSFRR